MMRVQSLLLAVPALFTLLSFDVVVGVVVVIILEARPEAFMSTERFERYDSIESATPGYCTFTAAFLTVVKLDEDWVMSIESDSGFHPIPK
jgi:hypothetical protein